jgi:patatin-like phospholipase/acyl hydrolase
MLEKLLAKKGPRKLLALDGGGIRGLIAVEILSQIETDLRKASQNPNLVLADYFDYIGGTSTGAIIASCLAIGMPVAKVREFYMTCGKEMFSKASWLNRHKYKYEDEKLSRMLKEIFGENTKLGSSAIRTLLMIVVRNATTDSPWPLSNNPQALYNARTDPGCNLELPLWQLVRASTAAPTFFPAEEVTIGPRKFVFVDGAVTVFNNPALQLFLMATAKPYNLNWETGTDKMLLCSIGTGDVPRDDDSLQADRMNILYSASAVPAALIGSALHQQDLLCRILGDCRAGDPIDSEIGALLGDTGSVREKSFAYIRYNAQLTRAGLDALGLHNIDPDHVRPLDSGDYLETLSAVGQAIARQRVKAEHFKGFPGKTEP